MLTVSHCIKSRVLLWVVLALLICDLLATAGCEKKHVARNKDSAIEDYDQNVSLAFQALLFWEAGQTNRYASIVKNPGFDSELRNCLVEADKNGRRHEIQQSLNSYIDLWIIVLSGSAVKHDWPVQERDPSRFQLVRSIAEYRQDHAHWSVSDANTSNLVKRTLDSVLARAAVLSATNSPSSHSRGGKISGR